MCGIVGVASHKNTVQISEQLIKVMADAIIHRGPDDYGSYVSGKIGMGMRRLSIIDVTGGHQPISNEDKTIWIVFNGEIYNHDQLRKALVSKGHIFKTNSDTEVIVHLYEEFGVDCVKKLRGMFAFAIWDNKKSILMLARDRIGIKPLFYYHADNTLLFASEIKSLFRSGLCKKSIDFTGLDHYFTFGYIPAPHSIYTGIKKLMPGYYLLYRDGNIETQQYWNLEFNVDEKKSIVDFSDEFISKFRECVKIHLMSEVPLGAFLSGGIDSSLIVALMAEVSHKKIKTFTMGFGGNVGSYNDERRYAKLVSAYYDTEHTELEAYPVLSEIMDKLVESFDEPFSDDSIIPSYYISREAAKYVKVALTGLGGDELFGGYERYLGLKLSEVYQHVPTMIRTMIINPLILSLNELSSGDYRVNHMKRFIRNSNLQEKDRYLGYISILNNSQKKLFYREHVSNQIHQSIASNRIDNCLESFSNCDYLQHATYRDIKTYLPEDILALTDRMSMQHSLELRVPFVDHEMVEFCASIPSKYKIRGFKKKYILKKIASAYLPKAILQQRKQGFAAPMTSWLKYDLRKYVSERLAPDNLSKHGFFNTSFIKERIDEHAQNREINDKFIFSMLVFQTWYENHYLKT